MKVKRNRKERPWPFADEQISRELGETRRMLQEGRGLIAGADVPRYRLPGFWREFR